MGSFTSPAHPTKRQPPKARAGYTYYRVVLSGDVTADNKLGTYRCEAMEAEHPGEHPGVLKVPFEGVPDVGIELIEANIPPPEIVSDWEWGSGQQ
jgi:hypothetical protein